MLKYLLTKNTLNNINFFQNKQIKNNLLFQTNYKAQRIKLKFLAIHNKLQKY